MKSLLHYPGSKKRIASWIIENMPEHHSYLDPYFGGGGMFFEKLPSKIETVNDLDGNVVNFFRVIQNPESRQELQEWLTYTPYSRQVYDESFTKKPESPVEQAGYFAIRSMQSHGFRLTEKCGWKKDVNGREAAYAVRYWNRLPEALADMAIRLKGVQIENKPALELIRAFDHENVLIYLDPPYVLSTRTRKQYRYEMSDKDHEELLKTVISSRAKIMLSGYDSKLYERYLKGWRKLQIPARAQNSLPRVETLWMNFEPVEQMKLK
ncbi:DNA adenine methylase [Lacrimispora amygdalina]|uniref:DNA adenine methylase n=1 Tax=Lacrimispora amygdalina TaxID=253257 RepID=A0A3E2N8J6_9FIRM|nr:DNA adenine methylase [Clostridium indicum]RFZ77337.1 DNA adenine methylase [Clostridium indicum]